MRFYGENDGSLPLMRPPMRLTGAQLIPETAHLRQAPRAARIKVGIGIWLVRCKI